MAAIRTSTGTPASAPGGNSTIRATTAAISAVATPLTHRMISDFFIEAAAEQDAEPTPDFARQETDQDKREVRLHREAHAAVLRPRCMR